MMTTKTCTKCEVAKPLTEFNKHKKFLAGLQYWCRECQKVDRASKKDHTAKINKSYNLNNRTKLNAKDAKWRKENPEKRSAIRLKYYLNNLDDQRLKQIARNKRNWERDRTKRYQYASNYRAMKRKASGKVTAAEWKFLLELYDNHCAYCREPFDKLTQDHLYPLIKGGAHSIDNIVPACHSCNSRKQKRNILKYYKVSGILPNIILSQAT